VLDLPTVKDRSFIPVNAPLLDGNEEQYLIDCVRTGWISSEGAYVKRFEKECAVRFGRRFAVAVANGTVALDLAIEVLNLQPGDEVILPTFTIISCLLPLLRRQLVPVFVDSNPGTFTIQTDALDALLTSRTKAIMAVHIYGLPADMNPILEFARSHQIAVIEDAAQAHGLAYYGRPCGSFGDISTFSFYSNKHLTTGEGGMVLTDDEKLFGRCCLLRNLAFEPHRRFRHHSLGYNYRLSNVQAALGCAQIERLDEFITRKRDMGTRYTALFKDYLGTTQLPHTHTVFAENNYWVYPLVLDKASSFNAADFAAALKAQGVDTRPFFYPLHLQSLLHGYDFRSQELLPHSEHIAQYGLYIPSGLALSKEQIDDVADRVIACWNQLSEDYP
jgi:perosamine synthetase